MKLSFDMSKETMLEEAFNADISSQQVAAYFVVTNLVDKVLQKISLSIIEVVTLNEEKTSYDEIRSSIYGNIQSLIVEDDLTFSTLLHTFVHADKEILYPILYSQCYTAARLIKSNTKVEDFNEIMLETVIFMVLKEILIKLMDSGIRAIVPVC